MKNSATQLNKDLEGFTKGEWKVDNSDENCLLIYSNSPGIIAYVEQDQDNELPIKANAEHIVKCVNSHSDLVAALQDIQSYIEESKSNFDEIGEDYPLDYGYLLSEINSALTKVK